MAESSSTTRFLVALGVDSSRLRDLEQDLLLLPLPLSLSSRLDFLPCLLRFSFRFLGDDGTLLPESTFSFFDSDSSLRRRRNLRRRFCFDFGDGADGRSLVVVDSAVLAEPSPPPPPPLNSFRNARHCCDARSASAEMSCCGESTDERRCCTDLRFFMIFCDCAMLCRGEVEEPCLVHTN